MAHELVDLTVERIAGVDKAANGRQFLIIKRADDEMADDKDTATLADLEKALSGLQEQVATLAKGGENKQPDTPPSDLQKRFDEEIRKRDERIEALETEAVRTRWADAVGTLTAVEKRAELVDELCTIEKASGREAADKVLARFATLQKQLEESDLLRELGTVRSGEDIPVEVRIETEVAKRMADHPEQNRAEVYAAVMKQHAPALAGRKG